ncbi:MAG: rane-bound metal-dependent hydrolase [Bryobacterales bacterium]|nr:rane-bound metal-dependent hydrolase [Bryobacterales bacterium]
MDNLTHSLVGLFLARAGFSKATARGTAIMVVAANAPDLDVVSLLGGAEPYLRWHRHVTHSLIAIPIIALVAVALVRYIGRKPLQWLPAWGIALVGVLSHVILDLTNVYGVRVLLPFSGRWFHWDITPIIDPTIFAILLLGVAAPALGRLVGSEIGDSKQSSGAGWAVAALALLLSYELLRSTLHDRVAAQVDAHRYNGLAPRRVGAFPTLNPLAWTGVAELSNAYVMVPVNVVESLHINDAETLYKAEQTPPVDAAFRTEPFQSFLEFVQYPLWVTGTAPDLEGATLVTLVDLRFGTPQAPGFASQATITRDGKVMNPFLTMSGTRPR